MDIRYDEDTFAEALLLVSQLLVDDPAGGAIKVNKILFFADFEHVRQHGRPLTGADYQKLEHGPAPRRLLPVREQLEATGAARVVEEQHQGFRQIRLLPQREPDLTRFSDDELETLRRVATKLRGRSGTSVSEQSHEDVGWQMVGLHESIPYEAAYLRPAVVSERVRQHAHQLAARLGLPR